MAPAFNEGHPAQRFYSVLKTSPGRNPLLVSSTPPRACARQKYPLQKNQKWFEMGTKKRIYGPRNT